MNICCQLGFGELKWFDAFEFSTSYSMTWVYSCTYDVAHHQSCTFSTVSEKYQTFVGCHKPGEAFDYCLFKVVGIPKGIGKTGHVIAR